MSRKIDPRQLGFPLGWNTNALYNADRVYTLGDNSTIAYDLNTEVYASDYVEQVAIDLFRIKTKGLYTLTASALFNNIQANYQHIEVHVRVNAGNRFSNRLIISTNGDNGNYSNVAATGTTPLEENDEIRMILYQNNTDNLSRTINNASSYTYLNINYLHPSE